MHPSAKLHASSPLEYEQTRCLHDPALLSSNRSVEFRESTAERVVIDVETDFDGYLFLSDAYYPGWHATIDGAPTTIYRADIMFRAVFVPAGAHEIVYTYDPFAR